jgi:chromosome partitioning protein
MIEQKGTSMKTIAIANQKGGVGKTTTTLNIGAGLTRLDKKVLLIDLDPQAHLTYSMGIMAHELTRTIYQVLKGEVTVETVILDSDGVKLIPSTLDLSGAEIELSRLPGREILLRTAISRPRDFDYILIDCPPSLGLLTLNAFTTAKEVYIPIQMEFLALQGMGKLLQTVEAVRKRLNKDLGITGVIGTRFDSRKVLNREIKDKVKANFGDKVFKTLIREDISLAEAPSFGKSIFEYRPDSHGAEDYLALCREIVERA